MAAFYDYAIRVFGTADGGKTWTVSSVAEDPDDCCAPRVELHFRDAKHGKVAKVTGGGHAYMQIETLNFYTTSDGGLTWRFLSRRCRYEDETTFTRCLI